MFDLAVQSGADLELGPWFAQAAFDPNPVIRQLTCAAIATVGVFVAPRRADAHALLSQAQRCGERSTALAAGLTALTAAIRGEASFPVAVLRADPEARTNMLADWGKTRLSGHPMREPEWRRLAGHVHPGRRGERLLRRLLRARTTRDVRDILQRISERRGGRSSPPVAHVELLGDSGVDGWPAHLGDRLSQRQQALLARRHPAPADSVAARIARMLADPAPLRCLADLELLALARRRDAALTHEWDARALLADLRTCMSAPDAPDPRLRGEALRHLASDPAVRRDLIASLPELHPNQRCLAQLAALWPEGAALRYDQALVEHLLHSGLAAELMRLDPPGGLDPHPEPWRRVDACARDLLCTGSGSLRGLDYPEFTLACRPSLSVVRPEHMDELRALGGLLATLRAGLGADDPAALLRALDEVAEHSPGTGRDALTALVEHACAYATPERTIVIIAPAADDSADLTNAGVIVFAPRLSALGTTPCGGGANEVERPGLA